MTAPFEASLRIWRPFYHAVDQGLKGRSWTTGIVRPEFPMIAAPYDVLGQVSGASEATRDFRAGKHVFRGVGKFSSFLAGIEGRSEYSGPNEFDCDITYDPLDCLIHPETGCNAPAGLPSGFKVVECTSPDAEPLVFFAQVESWHGRFSPSVVGYNRRMAKLLSGTPTDGLTSG